MPGVVQHTIQACLPALFQQKGKHRSELYKGKGERTRQMKALLLT